MITHTSTAVTCTDFLRPRPSHRIITAPNEWKILWKWMKGNPPNNVPVKTRSSRRTQRCVCVRGRMNEPAPPFPPPPFIYSNFCRPFFEQGALLSFIGLGRSWHAHRRPPRPLRRVLVSHECVGMCCGILTRTRYRMTSIIATRGRLCGDFLILLLGGGGGVLCVARFQWMAMLWWEHIGRVNEDEDDLPSWGEGELRFRPTEFFRKIPNCQHPTI